MLKPITLSIVLLFSAAAAGAQNGSPVETVKAPDVPVEKKANQRPPDTKAKEPFDGADVKMMAAQCVTLDTEKGKITLEMFPESAPETVRNFLNLTALGIFDSTTFSRIVPDFIVQGGNISTRESRTDEQTLRARRNIADEPNLIRHERGIVSMARPDEPNGASSNFFVLVGPASHLDGIFAAFARVTAGMDVVDEINKMEVDGDKPKNPIRISTATVSACRPS